MAAAELARVGEEGGGEEGKGKREAAAGAVVSRQSSTAAVAVAELRRDPIVPWQGGRWQWG